MNLRLLHNCITEAWVSLRRNGLMTLAGITTVAASMVTLGALYLFVRDLNGMVGRYAKETIVTVFANPGFDESRSRKIRAQVEALPHVVKVEYISKEQGAKLMVERFGEKTAEVIEELEMPAQVVANVDDVANTEAVAEAARQLEGVDRVNSAAKVTSRLVTFRAMLQRVGLIAMILLGLVALLTVNNTVHLAITAREQEIEIMQLVGATAWYVGTPFLLEGAIQGFLGGMVALVALALGYAELLDYVQTQLPFIPIGGAAIGIRVLLPLVVGAGMAFGVLGSFISVRRLLHVG